MIKRVIFSTDLKGQTIFHGEEPETFEEKNK